MFSTFWDAENIFCYLFVLSTPPFLCVATAIATTTAITITTHHNTPPPLQPPPPLPLPPSPPTTTTQHNTTTPLQSPPPPLPLPPSPTTTITPIWNINDILCESSNKKCFQDYFQGCSQAQENKSFSLNIFLRIQENVFHQNKRFWALSG